MFFHHGRAFWYILYARWCTTFSQCMSSVWCQSFLRKSVPNTMTKQFEGLYNTSSGTRVPHAIPPGARIYGGWMQEKRLIAVWKLWNRYPSRNPERKTNLDALANMEANLFMSLPGASERERYWTHIKGDGRSYPQTGTRACQRHQDNRQLRSSPRISFAATSARSRLRKGLNQGSSQSGKL